MAALFENKTTIAQTQIENGVRQQRQKEMEQLLNRFNKNKVEIDSDADDEVDVTENTAMIATATVKPLVANKRLSKLAVTKTQTVVLFFFFVL